METGLALADWYGIPVPLHGDDYGEYATVLEQDVFSMQSVPDVGRVFSSDGGGEIPDNVHDPCLLCLRSPDISGLELD